MTKQPCSYCGHAHSITGNVVCDRSVRDEHPLPMKENSEELLVETEVTYNPYSQVEEIERLNLDIKNKEMFIMELQLELKNEKERSLKYENCLREIKKNSTVTAWYVSLINKCGIKSSRPKRPKEQSTL